MKLYDFPFSPNCRKVRAVAYELGIPLDHVNVDLLKGEQKAATFLAKNPNGRVPVLEDGDLRLWESNAIVTYLATQYGKSASLVPSDPRGRAEVDRWMHWQLAHLGPATSKVAFERLVKKLTGQGEPDPKAVAAGTEEFDKCTAVLDASLEGKEYVAGKLSVADFVLAAHYSLATACGLDTSKHRRADAWLQRMLARDSMKRAIADAQAMR